MKKIGIAVDRRAFLRGAATAAPVAVVVGAELVSPSLLRAQTAEPYKPSYFTADEYAVLNGLVDTMIPADDTGPGGVEAGVAEFIDKQMNTPYAKGELWYMQAPHVLDAAPEYGYQRPETPAELYKKSLNALAALVKDKQGKPFQELSADQRNALMTSLEKNEIKLGDIPGVTFFNQLLQNVREGYFSDPAHGGNKGMAAWKMVGFPGARADYYDWVERYGVKYPLPPVAKG